jgi:L-amino acid N-acyltransferase YncA
MLAHVGGYRYSAGTPAAAPGSPPSAQETIVVTTQSPEAIAGYPHAVQLKDGSSITLRLMTPADRDALLAFARALPSDDLLFLRSDITDPEVVDEWVRNLGRRTITVLAEGVRGDGILGYGSLHFNETLWTRHVGEIRIQTGAAARGKELGTALAGAVFDIARALGLRKIQARMTPDQSGARATFEHLGFQMEALLADFVIDRDDQLRDMLIMSYDIGSLSDRADD